MAAGDPITMWRSIMFIGDRLAKNSGRALLVFVALQGRPSSCDTAFVFGTGFYYYSVSAVDQPPQRNESDLVTRAARGYNRTVSSELSNGTLSFSGKEGFHVMHHFQYKDGELYCEDLPVRKIWLPSIGHASLPV